MDSIIKNYDGVCFTYSVNNEVAFDKADVNILNTLCEKVDDFLLNIDDRLKSGLRLIESYNNILKEYLTYFINGEKYIVGSCNINLSIEYEIIQIAVKLIGVLQSFEDLDEFDALWTDICNCDIFDKVCDFENYLTNKYDTSSDYNIVEER